MNKRKRNHLSGSNKRKLRQRKDAEKEQLRNSFKKFLVSTEKNETENIVSEIDLDAGRQDETENRIQNESIKYNLEISCNQDKENLIIKEDSDLTSTENDENEISKLQNKSENNLEIFPGCNKVENPIQEEDSDAASQDEEEIENNTERPDSCSESKKNENGITQDEIENCFQNSSSLEENVKATEKKINPDPATWNENNDDNFIDYFIKNPPDQNIELVTATAKLIGDKKRSLSKNSFFRYKKNNEITKREWLVLSPSTLSVYCWVCKLFSKVKTALTSSGLNDWKHVNDRICEHENSVHHRDAIISMSLRLNSKQRIDSNLVSQFNSETKYWRNVLTRVVATVKFLSKRGLSFFGCDETIGSVKNGNFLGCLELISEFDPFLANHLNKYGNCGTGRANYISTTTINEFIDIMSQKVQNEIIKEVKHAKYYSIITDSTPDISHVDQLCLVIRYVDHDNLPVERFLTFIPTQSHRAEHLFDTISACLKDLNLDILDCRGQSYDNASNMSGRYLGLQARLKAVNPYAIYVPCAAHSLNLVGSNAAEVNLRVSKFFSLVQQIYNFFTVSTHRWQHVKNKVKEKETSIFSLKSRSNTRWSADAEAVKALRKNYKYICETLNEFSSSEIETSVTKNESKSLYDELNKFETAINLVVWDAILQRLNATNKIIQDPAVNLSTLPKLFESLIDFVQLVRKNYDKYEKEALIILPDATYSVTRKKFVPRNKWLDDKNTPEAELSPRKTFIVTCHYSLCDNLIAHLSRRKEPYDKIVHKFSCLLNLKSMSLNEEANALQKSYPDDLSDDFSSELQQFITFSPDKNKSIPDMFKILKELNLCSTFPNLETALRIFLSIPISNCSGERSFSLLKRLKSKSRSTMDQDKLSNLAILCIESDVTDRLNYDDIIANFAEKKSRKMSVKI